MKPIKYLQGTLLAAVALSLSGCSIFGGDELTYKELQPFNETVTPEVVWDESAGGGIDDFFSRLNPVVSDNLVIAADRAGRVTAFDRESGDRVWQRDLQAEFAQSGEGWLGRAESLRISGGLSEYNDKVVLGTENGDLIALNATDGQVLWHQKINAEILSNPALDATHAVVAAGNGEIFAFSMDDGEQLWSLPTDVPALTLRGTASPTLAAGGAIFGTATGKLSVVVTSNGQQAWETRLAVPKGATELQRLVDVDSTPLVRGNTIYNVAYNGQLAAVEIRNGRVIWQREYSSFQNLALQGSILYVTDVDDRVYAINTDGGIENWVNDDLEGRELTAPVYFNGQIVVGDDFGYLHFIDAKTGEMAGRLDVGDPIYVAPVVAEDKLYLQTRDGTLLAVRTN